MNTEWSFVTDMKTLSGKLYVLFAWYSDQWENSKSSLIRAINQVDKVVYGKILEIPKDVCYDIWDALGSFPEKDEELDKIYDTLSEYKYHFLA